MPAHRQVTAYQPITGAELVTGILVSWQREQNVPPIVAGMLANAWLDELILWDNARAQPEADHYWRARLVAPVGKRLIVLGSDRNLGTYARYLASALASNPLIATCDDDWLVENWQQLHDLEAADRITHALDRGHYAAEAHGRQPWALVGWGAIFSRRSVDVLKAYIERFGEDALLERKADRIWSMLHGSHLAIPAVGQRLPGDMGPAALCLRRDHQALTQQAVQRCRFLLGSQRHQEKHQEAAVGRLGC